MILMVLHGVLTSSVVIDDILIIIMELPLFHRALF